jgi:surface antigen
MRSAQPFFPIAAVALVGFWFSASIFLYPSLAEAGDRKNVITSLEDNAANPKVTKPKAIPESKPVGKSATPSCQCPESRERMAKPKFAGLSGTLDEGDELAALSSLHMALNTAGDGQAYVWHRDNGKLSGFIKPRSTFRNDSKQLCRHVEVMLTTGFRTDRIESTACRQTGGQWKLEG